ncbi:MAG: hypothetical protein ACJ8FN_10075, partial [Sphingomicrobium sp.]
FELGANAISQGLEPVARGLLLIVQRRHGNSSGPIAMVDPAAQEIPMTSRKPAAAPKVRHVAAL